MIDIPDFASVFSIEMAVSAAEVPPEVTGFVSPSATPTPTPVLALKVGSSLGGGSVQLFTAADPIEVDEDADFDPPPLNPDSAQVALAPLSIGAQPLPVIVPPVPLAPPSGLAQGLSVTGPEVAPGDTPGSSFQPPMAKRSLPLPKMSHPAGPKISPEISVAGQISTVRTAETAVASEAPLVRPEYAAVQAVDRFVAPVEGGRTLPTVALPSNAPADRLFAALAHQEPADREWLDTVIRDVATVAAGKAGNIRFRVEPEGYGKMTIEQTADRLEISVSDPRSLVLAEAARPQVLAGAAALGLPVAGASVVLDQSGHRSRDDARQRQQIEHRDAEEVSESGAPASGRYA
jgi:hypothetical protein